MGIELKKKTISDRGCARARTSEVCVKIACSNKHVHLIRRMVRARWIQANMLATITKTAFDEAESNNKKISERKCALCECALIIICVYFACAQSDFIAYCTARFGSAQRTVEKRHGRLAALHTHGRQSFTGLHMRSRVSVSLSHTLSTSLYVYTLQQTPCEIEVVCLQSTYRRLLQTTKCLFELFLEIRFPMCVQFQFNCIHYTRKKRCL